MIERDKKTLDIIQIKFTLIVGVLSYLYSIVLIVMWLIILAVIIISKKGYRKKLNLNELKMKENGENKKKLGSGFTFLP